MDRRGSYFSKVFNKSTVVPTRTKKRSRAESRYPIIKEESPQQSPRGFREQWGGNSYWEQTEERMPIPPEYHDGMFASYSLNQSDSIIEGIRPLRDRSYSDQSYDDLADVLSAAWEQSAFKERTFREEVIRRKLGWRGGGRTFGRQMSAVSTASVCKASQRARTASSWLVWLVEKLVGVDADPPRPNILAKIIHIVSIFITFAYCGIFAIFLSIQLKEEKDTDQDPEEKIKEILINQTKYLWKATLCIYYKSVLRKLINDDLMVRTLLKHVTIITPIPVCAFFLGIIFASLDIYDDFQLNYNKIYPNVQISRYAEPTLLAIRSLISLMSIIWSSLLLVLLGGWCHYLSGEIKSFFRDLDEDAVICEYNFHVQAKEEAKRGKNSESHSESNLSSDENEQREQHAQGSPTPSGVVECRHYSEIEIITNEELLLLYTRLKERLVYTSDNFEKWLAISLFSCCMDSVIFLFLFVTKGAEIGVILREVCILAYLPVLTQNVLRVNSQLSSLPKHLYPLPIRSPVFTLMTASRAELSICGAPLTYGSVCAVFLAICVGLITRLLVKLPGS